MLTDSALYGSLYDIEIRVRVVFSNATLPPLRPQHDLSDMTGSPNVIDDCLPSDAPAIRPAKASGAPRLHPMTASFRV